MEEGLNIPLWFVVLTGGFGGVFLSWLVWLTKKTHENDKAIALNTSADQNSKDKLVEVKSDVNNRIDKLEKHFDSKFELVFKKIEAIRK